MESHSLLEAILMYVKFWELQLFENSKNPQFQLLLPDKQQLILGNRTSLFSFGQSGRGRPMTTSKVTHWSELFFCIRWIAPWSEDLCIPCCQIHKWVRLTAKSYFIQTFSYVIILMVLRENWTQILQKSNLRWPSHFQKRGPCPSKGKRILDFSFAVSAF